MLNHYIINGFIEFHPVASTLRNLSDPDKVIVLNSPAGRCLLLLIKRIDTIVTQHEFMKIVWEENGMLVTPNTFYQNISILRKGLKKIGLDEDLVVTIPRVGLTLASGTQIKTLSSESPGEADQEDAYFMDENPEVQEVHEEVHSMQLPESGSIEPLKKVDIPQLPSMSTQISVQEIPPHFSLWAVGILAILLLVVEIGITITDNDAGHYFDDYAFLANANGCHIFIANKNATAEEKKRTLSLVKNFQKSCKDYPWIYVTHYFMLPRISLLRCNKEMDESNSCISEYYFRGLNYGD